MVEESDDGGQTHGEGFDRDEEHIDWTREFHEALKIVRNQLYRMY